MCWLCAVLQALACLPTAQALLPASCDARTRWMLIGPDCTAGAPLVVTKDLLNTFNISIVARGTVTEMGHKHNSEDKRYETPKQMGIFK